MERHSLAVTADRDALALLAVSTVAAVRSDPVSVTTSAAALQRRALGHKKRPPSTYLRRLAVKRLTWMHVQQEGRT